MGRSRAFALAALSGAVEPVFGVAAALMAAAAGAVMLPRPAPAFSSWCSSALSGSRSPCETVPVAEPKSRELRSMQRSSSSEVLPAETAALSCRMALRTSLSRSDAPEALPARESRLET